MATTDKPLVEDTRTVNPFTARQVENAHAELGEAAKMREVMRGSAGTVDKFKLADVALQRAALKYAAAKLAETGEYGTKDALTLLRQISEDL